MQVHAQPMQLHANNANAIYAMHATKGDALESTNQPSAARPHTPCEYKFWAFARAAWVLLACCS
eukprot:10078748-Lingulodinium_polyedra.AAC.1